MNRAMQTALLLVAVALPLACENGRDSNPEGAGGGRAGGSGASGSGAGEPSQMSAGSPGNDDGMAGAGASSAGAPALPEGNQPQALNGCTAKSFEDHGAKDDERVVRIAVEGLKFTPPCISIAIGQSVRFEGSLASHPLAPGNANHPDAGSPDSPIRETTSGTSVEFAFGAPGTYPYYCELHGFGDGMGMSGVVFVK
jgi:plastocyanin